MNELMKVDRVDQKYVYLLTQRAGSCNTCGLKGACNITGNPDIRIRAKINPELDLNKDDFVVVKLPKVSVTKMSFLVYGIPLIVFIATTVISSLLGLSDIPSFAIGFSVMILAYIFLGIYDRKYLKDKYLPEILEKYKTSSLHKSNTM
jgi:sigma-E factor negative regulatory protein RseC